MGSGWTVSTGDALARVDDQNYAFRSPHPRRTGRLACVKTHPSDTFGEAPAPDWPDASSLAALRAWYEGMGSRNAVERYFADRPGDGASSRSTIGRIRRQVIAFAVARHRRDLAEVLSRATPGDAKAVRKVCGILESLPGLAPPLPLAGDDIERWLSVRLAAALRAAGVRTLVNLAMRMQARRRWWPSIVGVGAAGAREVESFFAAHPQLVQAVRALVVRPTPQDLVPWERLVVPEAVDGSTGTFRAPRATCALAANNDYQAVHAWLSLHEAAATRERPKPREAFRSTRCQAAWRRHGHPSSAVSVPPVVLSALLASEVNP